MQISNNNNLNFTAKNPFLRKMDDIARCIPGTSKLSGFTEYDSFKRLSPKRQAEIRDTMDETRKEMFRRMMNAGENYYRKLLAVIVPPEANKLANCAECAQYANVVAKMNGVEGGQLKKLVDRTTGKNMDHVVVSFVDKSNGKNVIVDAWNGEALYEDDMLRKFSGIYSKRVLGGGTKGVQPRLAFEDVDYRFNPINRFFLEEMPDDARDRLKKRMLEYHPNFILENRK